MQITTGKYHTREDLENKVIALKHKQLPDLMIADICLISASTVYQIWKKYKGVTA